MPLTWPDADFVGEGSCRVASSSRDDRRPDPPQVRETRAWSCLNCDETRQRPPGRRRPATAARACCCLSLKAAMAI